MKRRYNEAQRRHLFEEQRWTGESLGVVAERLGIGKSTAYKWAGQGKPAAASKQAQLTRVSFAQLVRATPVSWLVVEVGRAAVRVPVQFDTEHLRRVVQALSGAHGA